MSGKLEAGANKSKDQVCASMAKCRSLLKPAWTSEASGTALPKLDIV